MKKYVKVLLAGLLCISAMGALSTPVSAAEEATEKSGAVDREQGNITNPSLLSGAYIGDTMGFFNEFHNEIGADITNFSISTTVDAELLVDLLSVKFAEFDADGNPVSISSSYFTPSFAIGANGEFIFTLTSNGITLKEDHSIAIYFEADVTSAATVGNDYSVLTDFNGTDANGTAYAGQELDLVSVKDNVNQVFDVIFILKGKTAAEDQTLSATQVKNGDLVDAPEVSPHYDYSNFYTVDSTNTKHDWDFATSTVTAHTVIYVERTPKVFTVTLNNDGRISTHQVAYGSYYKVSPTPSKAGHTFDGWYTDAAFTNKFDLETTYFTADTTLYAKFVPNTPVTPPVTPVTPTTPTTTTTTTSPKTNYVNTGIQNNLGLYLAVAGVSLVGLALVAAKRKKLAK